MEHLRDMQLGISCAEEQKLNGRGYLLLQLDLNEHSRYIAAVIDGNECEMAVLGKDRATAGEQFRLLTEGEISPVHLRDAVADIINGQEYANI